MTAYKRFRYDSRVQDAINTNKNNRIVHRTTAGKIILRADNNDIVDGGFLPVIIFCVFFHL